MSAQIPGLGGLLKGPVGDLINGVRGVVDDLHTSGEEKNEAKRRLLEQEQVFLLKAYELGIAEAQVQADVIKTESASGHWLTSVWRPVTMLAFLVILLYAMVVAPIFGLPIAAEPFVMEVFEIIKLGIGGYVIGRSGEKIVKEYRK